MNGRKLKNLIIRSAEFDHAISAILSLVNTPPFPKCRLSTSMAGISKEHIKPEDLIGENGLLKQLTKVLVERALQAEMSDHLGHDKNEAVSNASGNTRSHLTDM